MAWTETARRDYARRGLRYASDWVIPRQITDFKSRIFSGYMIEEILMKTSRFNEPQILAIVRQAEGGVRVPELCREHGMSTASFYKWRSKYGGMEPRREPSPEEDVCGDEHAGGTAQRGSWKKVTRPSQRREMAEKAVALRGVSVALACRTFEVSETCYRYSARLNDENEQIADLLIGLTRAKKTWGFGLCFLHRRNVRGHHWNHKRVSLN